MLNLKIIIVSSIFLLLGGGIVLGATIGADDTSKLPLEKIADFLELVIEQDLSMSIDDVNITSFHISQEVFQANVTIIDDNRTLNMTVLSNVEDIPA